MERVKVNIADLTGPALDWAVAVIVLGCEMIKSGNTGDYFWARDASGKFNFGWIASDPSRKDMAGEWRPSADWSQGGPLIERHGVSWMCVLKMAGISVSSGMNWAAWIGESGRSYGSTPLIAAMRAIVASNTDGDTIEVPADLLEASK